MAAQKPMRCYNCGKLDAHISDNCREPPRFTKCRGCKKMCTCEASHKPSCTNKSFVSSLIEDDMIRSTNTLASFELSVHNVKFGLPQSIDSSLELPIILTSKMLFVTKVGDKIEIKAFPFGGGDGEPLRFHHMVDLLIYDENVFRGHVHFDKERGVLVNGHIKIAASGVEIGKFKTFEVDRPIAMNITCERPSPSFFMNISAFKKVFMIEFVEETTARLVNEFII